MTAPRITADRREYVRSGGTWVDARTHMSVPLALAARLDALARSDPDLWASVRAWDASDRPRTRRAAAWRPFRRWRGCRETHCWNCGKPISDSTHERCEECNWIQCDCGACGCEYPN